jgi:hypothetical protein
MAHGADGLRADAQARPVRKYGAAWNERVSAHDGAETCGMLQKVATSCTFVVTRQPHDNAHMVSQILPVNP